MLQMYAATVQILALEQKVKTVLEPVKKSL